MIKWTDGAPIETDQSQQFGPRKIACARREPINTEKKGEAGIIVVFATIKQLILLFVLFACSTCHSGQAGCGGGRLGRHSGSS